MNKQYKTKYIIQARLKTKEESAPENYFVDWEDYYSNGWATNYEETVDEIAFYRKVHGKTHEFRMVKRDYVIEDTVLEEK
jgi:hypothetical protein